MTFLISFRKHGYLCCRTIIHMHSSIYIGCRRGFSTGCKSRENGQRKFGRASREWRASKFTIVALRLPSIWRAGAARYTHAHTHARNVLQVFARGFVREVSSPSQLYRLSPVIVAAPTTTRRQSSW